MLQPPDALPLGDQDNAGVASPYCPLSADQIRVLILHPGRFGEPLHGTFYLAMLFSPTYTGDGTRFQAISYAWGASDTPYQIHFANARSVPITVSLYWALQHLRYETDERHLWADAICINQPDITERNSQVAIMSAIYSASGPVLAWLGDGDSSDALAFATISACGQLQGEVRHGSSLALIRASLYQLLSDDDQARLHSFSEDVALVGLSAVIRLTQRRWSVSPPPTTLQLMTRDHRFGRLWAAQEIWPEAVTDVTICSGFFSCPRELLWDTLRVAEHNWYLIKTVTHLSAADQTVLRFVAEFLSVWNVSNPDPISELLHHSYRACSDPRDRVFALRSILRIRNVAALRPDYTLSADELFRRLVSYFLARPAGPEYNHALILALVGTENENPAQDSERPSWVANVDELSAASRVKSYLYQRHSVCNTGDKRSNAIVRRGWEDNWSLFRPELTTKTSTKRRTGVTGLLSRPDPLEFEEDLGLQDIESRPDPSLQKPNILYNSRYLHLPGRCFATCSERLSLPSIPASSNGRLSLDPDSTADVETFVRWYVACRRDFVYCVWPRVYSRHGIDNELVKFLSYPTTFIPDQDHQFWTKRIAMEHFQKIPRYTLPSDLAFTPALRVHMHWLMTQLPECPLARMRQAWKIITPTKTDIAWLPSQTLVGDQICIFAGAPWPFVVRPTADVPFNLVGDGHVHSISLMEALGGRYEERTKPEGVQQGYPLSLNMPSEPVQHLLAQLPWMYLQ